MLNDAPFGWLESIDHMVDEKREELDAIYNRFNGPGAARQDPITITLNKQKKREKHYDRGHQMLCGSWPHETVREDHTIKHTHTVGKDNDRCKDEYYN